MKIHRKELPEQACRRVVPFLVALSLTCASSRAARAGEPTQAVDAGRIVEAMKRALPIVETAAESYPYHRECFSCHHQTLPMLAMIEVSGRGLETNANLLAEQAE